jgi:hypothetical protein
MRGLCGMLRTVSDELTPRMMRVRLSPDEWRTLRVMAAERGSSMQALVAGWASERIAGRSPNRVISEAAYREASPAPQEAPSRVVERSPAPASDLERSVPEPERPVRRPVVLRRPIVQKRS